VLMVVAVIGGIMAIVTASMLMLSNNSLQRAHGRVDWNKAFYISENAVVWAAQNVFDNPGQFGAGSSKSYSTKIGNLPLAKIISPINGDPAFKNACVNVVQPNSLQTNVFVITASAKVNDKVRTIQVTMTARPVSSVFDYEYFLNNWGWWWGSAIYGYGSQRSNWYFDFRDNPTVDGAIFAAALVEENEQPYPLSSPPFGGWAGADPQDLVHEGVPRVAMPNLLDFNVYSNTAMADTTKNGIWVGGRQVVAGVLQNQASLTGVLPGSPKPGGNGGNQTPQTGLYLAGSASQPITIKGTVVIPGDVVIQGQITGQGTLYVGGNLYIANNITYANGPDFSTPPEIMTPAARDAWVQNNMSKDLIAFAVRGSVFAGDVTDPDWISWCRDYPGSGLASVGDESNLGPDGIANTPDDGQTFLHSDGSVSAWYDADGDGICEGNYNYATDINMDSTRASYILGYPTDSSNQPQPLPYNQVATDNMGTLDGMFYTDHALAMRLAQSAANFYGGVISRNEQIVFQSTCAFNYDSRFNSRYHNNPNQFINLGLPYGKPIQVNIFSELAPDSTGL
jgi:hypothetical protein